MVTIEIQKVDEDPICPYCEKKIDTIVAVSKGSMTKHMVYICPKCKKILSIGFNEYT